MISLMSPFAYGHQSTQSARFWYPKCPSGVCAYNLQAPCEAERRKPSSLCTHVCVPFHHLLCWLAWPLVSGRGTGKTLPSGRVMCRNASKGARINFTAAQERSRFQKKTAHKLPPHLPGSGTRPIASPRKLSLAFRGVAFTRVNWDSLACGNRLGQGLDLHPPKADPTCCMQIFSTALSLSIPDLPPISFVVAERRLTRL